MSIFAVRPSRSSRPSRRFSAGSGRRPLDGSRKYAARHGERHRVQHPEAGLQGRASGPRPRSLRESDDSATCNRCHLDGGALGGGANGNNNTLTSVALANDDIGVPVVGVALPNDEGTITTAFAGRGHRHFVWCVQYPIDHRGRPRKPGFTTTRRSAILRKQLPVTASDDFLVGGPKGRPIGTVKPQGGWWGSNSAGRQRVPSRFPPGTASRTSARSCGR